MSKIFNKLIVTLLAASVMLAPVSASAADNASMGLSLGDIEQSAEAVSLESDEVTTESSEPETADQATEESSDENGETAQMPVSTVESVEEAMNGVVQVNTVFTDEAGVKHIIYGGSGILIGSTDKTQYVLTNNHIVNPDSKIKKAAYKYYQIPKKDNGWDNINPYTEIVFENDMAVTASVVNSSENLDLVVLKLAQPNHNRTPLTFLVQDPDGKEKPYTTTDSVYGLGFPEGISYENPVCYSNKQVTMSSGKVANVTDYSGADLIQHNAQVSVNNCGGPLLNDDGLVIGMNELVADGNNFYSLDSTEIANILDSLGIEYNKMTMSEYEIWQHRNDEPEPEPVVIPAPQEPTVVVTEDTKTPVWVIVSIIVLAVLVLALIAVFIVMLMKQNKRNADPAKEAAKKEKKEKKQAEKAMPQMRPIQNIPSPSGSMETGVIGGEQGAGQTTVLNAANAATAAGEPLITSGTLIRRKNSDNIIIDKQSFSIGKDSLHVDYCITDNPAVSRTHASINTINNQVFLQDCHSTNGTFINNRKIAEGSSEAIKDGDIIKIADEEFQYRI